MLRTALLAALWVLGGLWAASGLTHGFQVWTDEDARRLEVALHPVPAPPVPVQGPDVSAADLPALLAQDGGATIVDFVYTRCQTVCLTLGSSFQQLQADLRETAASGAAPVRLLSISFDGARDDPPALRAYAGQLKADLALWRFVRVPDARAEQALLRRLGVVVVPDGRGGFEHNAALLVFDARGRLLRVFDLRERQLALDYARHVARRQPAAPPA